MATKIAINGFGRIGRCIVRAIARAQREGPRARRDQRSDRRQDARAPLQLRQRARPRVAPRQGARRRRSISACPSRRSSPRRIPRSSRGRSSASTSCSSARASSPTRRRPSRTSAAGAKKVIISAPAKGQDATIVLGVNTEAYDAAKHTVISCGSCTTNCLAPVAKVLLDNFGIKRGLMTTIHSYTNDQARPRHPAPQGRPAPRARRRGEHDPVHRPAPRRRSREVIPALKGKFDGQSIRVPTMDVSIVDLTFETEKPITKDTIHAAMKDAAEGPMKGILDYIDEPARLERLHRRPALVDLRRDDHAGHRRQLRQGLLLVRQRVGLLEPHGRARAARRREALNRLAGRMSNPLHGIRTIRELPIENKRVFLRVDFNVPLDGSARSRTTRASARRFRPSSTRSNAGRGSSCASHLGRPKKGRDAKYSLEPVRRAPRRAARARRALCPKTASATRRRRSCSTCAAGQVCLLENLRFHPEEEKDDEAFCRAARRAGRRLRRRRVRLRSPRARERARRSPSSIATGAAASCSRRRSPSLGKTRRPRRRSRT